MAAVAHPILDAADTFVEECGAPDCDAEVTFSFDGDELRSLAPDRSLISGASCPVCDAPQHVVLWETGERSGPWLELRRRRPLRP